MCFFRYLQRAPSSEAPLRDFRGQGSSISGGFRFELWAVGSRSIRVLYGICATVDIMDSKAILKMDYFIQCEKFKPVWLPCLVLMKKFELITLCWLENSEKPYGGVFPCALFSLNASLPTCSCSPCVLWRLPTWNP